jgi:ABC-type nickel/cobalt efflux system permease component RcnA
MFEELALAVFCLLATVIGLAVAAWEVISGRVFDMDGLWLTLISLTLAAVFGGTLAWSFYTGEGRQMLRQLRKGSAAKDASEKEPPATS